MNSEKNLNRTARHASHDSANGVEIPINHKKRYRCKPGTGELPIVVSLFSGAGGLDMGFHQEGFDVSIAMDVFPAAIETINKNFKNTKGIVADFIKLEPQGVLKIILEQIPEGARIGVIGGPPCQGFSRANCASKPDDPRNRLPDLYIDIINMLNTKYQVDFVIFENVMGIKDKKHRNTYGRLVSKMFASGFDVYEKELCALDFGVPQKRRRLIVAGVRSGQGFTPFCPLAQDGPKTVGEAIAGLNEPAFFSKSINSHDIPLHPNHWTMKPKSHRFQDPEGKHFDGRSFRRLVWTEPSPTIAFGNREIHVHPNAHRRLSIFEAMLLQGFPSSFVIQGNFSQQVTQVSNAVPPPLARSLAAAIKRSLFGG